MGLTLSQLEAMGLVERRRAGARAKIKLVPYDGFSFASDRYSEAGPKLAFNHVTGVNPTSLTLAALTIRRPVVRTLDMGTGCGVQALLAARHSSTVVAADINPRALNMTAFNTLLNNIDNVQCRLGDFFEPVRDNLFDLIVCNPPYVISPDHDYVYRDSGLPGDSVCQKVVRQIPAHLSEGGTAHVLCNWGHQQGAEWAEPIRHWVEGNGCDVWLLHYNTEDPLSYTSAWNQPILAKNFSEYSRTLTRWLTYYRKLGIGAISTGAIILRRRSNGPNWLKTDSFHSRHIAPCSEHILRVFGSQDLLSRLHDERDLLSMTFLPAKHHLEQTMVCQDGRYVVQDTSVYLEEGLRFRGKVDEQTIQLMSRCDGKRTLGEITGELALIAGTDKERLTPAILFIARRLLGSGFLSRG